MRLPSLEQQLLLAGFPWKSLLAQWLWNNSAPFWQPWNRHFDAQKPGGFNPAPGIHRRFSCQEAKLQSWLGTKIPPSPPLRTRKKTLRYAVICSGKLFNFFLSSLKHGFRKTSHFLGLKKLQTLPSDSCHITVCPVESMLTTLTRSTKLPVSLLHAEKTPAVSQHTETMGIPWQGGPAA